MYNQPPRKTVATLSKNGAPGKPMKRTAITEQEFFGPPKMTAKPGMATPKRHKMMRAPGVGRR